jgi:MFS family permease
MQRNLNNQIQSGHSLPRAIPIFSIQHLISGTITFFQTGEGCLQSSLPDGPALLRGFPNWSRAEVSLLPRVLALSAGISVLPVGWLIDRIEARLVIIAGALLAAGSFLLASTAHSLATMMGAYLILGLGISAGTVLPASLVLANWFTERRGLAMGIALSGSTVGGSLMTLVAVALWIAFEM